MNQKIAITLDNINRYLPLFIVLAMTSLMMFASLRIIYRTLDFTTAIMSNDLSCISNALAKLHTSCTIVSFNKDHTSLDFLTMPSLATLSGERQVTLAQPENWQGPYLTELPTIQGKAYEICSAHDGYFLMPGHGVQLPNGLIMGVDVVITPEVSVTPLLTTGKALNYQGEQLAKKLDLGKTLWCDAITMPTESPTPRETRQPSLKKNIPSSALHAFKIHLPKKVS